MVKGGLEILLGGVLAFGDIDRVVLLRFFALLIFEKPSYLIELDAIDED